MGSDAASAEREEALVREKWGPAAARIIEGSLLGTPDRAAETVARYIDEGAVAVNIALRAPWDAEALTAYVERVIPQIRASTQ